MLGPIAMTTPHRRPWMSLACRSLFTAVWLSLLPDLRAAKPDKEEIRALKRAAAAEGLDTKTKPLSDAAGTRIDKKATGSGSTESARILDRLRDRLEVNDDDEWALIAERITQVEDARRALGSAANGAIKDVDKRAVAGAKTAHPERDSLRSAVGDRLPDAEINLRLARARDVYRENESRLRRAQSELRAVLSVRQEAIAVLAGLLPP